MQCIVVLYRAQIICNMGDALGPELATCLPIFLDRLKNEITRLTAVKALSMIAEYATYLIHSYMYTDVQ